MFELYTFEDRCYVPFKEKNTHAQHGRVTWPWAPHEGKFWGGDRGSHLCGLYSLVQLSSPGNRLNPFLLSNLIFLLDAGAFYPWTGTCREKKRCFFLSLSLNFPSVSCSDLLLTPLLIHFPFFSLFFCIFPTFIIKHFKTTKC